MTHPDELLADYVDGTLTPDDRAAVDAHLTSCARCRAEVDVASRAARALATLAEPPAPVGLADAALREARAPSPTRAAAPRWYRAAAIAAAAAAIALVVVTLPHLGGGSNATSASSASIEAAANGGAAPNASGADSATKGAASLVHQRRDYDPAALQDLATSAASFSAGPTGTPGTADETRTALRCVITAGAPTDQQLQSLVVATFQGTPAYIAVFAQGPGAGQPADTIVVWAIDVKTCQLLSFSQHRI